MPVTAYPSLHDETGGAIECHQVTWEDAANIARVGYYIWRLARLIKPVPPV